MANALGGAACSDLDAGAPPFVLPSAPSAPLTLSAVEKTLSARGAPPSAPPSAPPRSASPPPPAPPASCATARAAARVAAENVSLVSTLCEQIASERRRGDRLEESLRAAERELERRARRLRELSDAADAWREALSEREAETRVLRETLAEVRGDAAPGADHPPRRVATPPTVATPTPPAPPRPPRAPSPQHASFACALRSPSPSGAAPGSDDNRARPPPSDAADHEKDREKDLSPAQPAPSETASWSENASENSSASALPPAQLSRAQLSPPSPARFVYVPKLPPAFVSAFLRDPSDPSSDPVLDWDEACASLANALVARGVGEAAGVVVKRARRLRAKQPTTRRAAGRRDAPAAATFDSGVDSDSEDRARRDALRDHRFYAVVEMARWDDAELRERVFPRVGSPRRASGPRDEDDDEGDDDDEEEAAEAEEDARRRHPVGRALVPGLLFGEAVEFRPHLEAGATSSDRRVAAEGGAASGNSRREHLETPPPLRAKAPFSTREGWFDTGETRDTANRRGARVHEGPCSRCREACRVPFRPVEGGRPPVCGQCFGKDEGGGA